MARDGRAEQSSERLINLEDEELSTFGRHKNQ